jgi:hypothetical protein
MVVAWAVPVLAGPGIFFRGDLTDLHSDAHPTDGAWGVATATVQNGRTIVRLNVKGLDRVGAGTTFGAHVHKGGCVHHDPSVAEGHFAAGLYDDIADDEVWLDFTVTAGGSGHAEAIAGFEIPPGGANSIVIHALPTNPLDGSAGPRVACLPLEF